jgi:hypothetical protein
MPLTLFVAINIIRYYFKMVIEKHGDWVEHGSLIVCLFCYSQGGRSATPGLCSGAIAGGMFKRLEDYSN